ncbi:antibiotic transporter [Gordonia oryzae]|uniref:Antibiotic transporter n=1 Tax=Gordonia oryzae TaxID=2487349 RepID=A0A3N4H4H2_9ACTN|nr:ABC transporter permease [Gordonia oryzae]RPA66291.1 antibiotic transporter [Gordonia oryzae]
MTPTSWSSGRFTGAGSRETYPSGVQQWWVLTTRSIVPTLRNGELLTQVAASIMFTAGFYIPLKNFMGLYAAEMSSYAQYLMPLIALQAISFAAISGAFRSASDAIEGINRRFRALPISRVTPLASRMTASMYRCTVALVISLICGYVIGFRFYAGTLYTVAFCGLVLAIGLTLSFLGEVVGTASRNPDATTHLMMLPQLIFGLLSVGVQPASAFPRWIQGFVRNQPISQFVYALRALAGDRIPGAAGAITWQTIGPSLAWIAALWVVLMPVYAVLTGRKG